MVIPFGFEEQIITLKGCERNGIREILATWYGSLRSTPLSGQRTHTTSLPRALPWPCPGDLSSGRSREELLLCSSAYWPCWPTCLRGNPLPRMEVRALVFMLVSASAGSVSSVSDLNLTTPGLW